MRFSLFAALLFLAPSFAQATDAPPGQKHLTTGTILRGHFIEERPMKGMATPLQSTGRFTLAPARGLIWNIEQPFPTSTIITPNGAVQDLGGLAVKLPAKNLRHLYDMVGGALQGDWSGLEQDFTLNRSGNAKQWQILLTPRAGDSKPKLNYATIIVTGAAFVENITMTKGDGSVDQISFSDETLSPATLTPIESKLFSEGGNL